MNSKLSAYIDSLFASAPQTAATRELKEEMLQNLTDKYNDLIAEGKTEDEAYRIAVSGIGDVSALIGGKANAPVQSAAEAAPTHPRNGLVTAIAVALYALAVIPILFLSGVTGVLLMFDMIAIATGLLIWDSPKHERPYAAVIAVAVMLYILCATPCIALNSVAGVVLLFVILAIASALLVYNGSAPKAPVSDAAGTAQDGDAGAQRMQKIRKTLAGVGALLTLALMIVLLAFSVTDSRRMQYYVTDDIMFEGGVANDLGDAWEAYSDEQDADRDDDDFDDDRDDHDEHAAAPGAVAPAPKDKPGKKGGSAANGVQSGVASGSASVPAADIVKIEIDWVAGNVKLEPGTGSEIEFAESSVKELTDGQKLRYRVQDGKLSISYCEETFLEWNWLFDLERLTMPSKDLTVKLPADLMGRLQKLEINAVSAEIVSTGAYGRETDFETVSGSIHADGIAGTELSAQSTSGKVVLTNCNVRELDVETVSGGAELAATAVEVDLQTVSGGMRLELASAPAKLETEAVSGNITVALPESAADFSAKLETVSGEFTCAFPTVAQDGRFIAGTGAAKFSFESVSGDVRIEKK